jgi:hypothetical protein
MTPLDIASTADKSPEEEQPPIELKKPLPLLPLLGGEAAQNGFICPFSKTGSTAASSSKLMDDLHPPQVLLPPHPKFDKADKELRKPCISMAVGDAWVWVAYGGIGDVGTHTIKTVSKC